MSKKVKNDSHHVAIVGGGFGGLYAAQTLGRAPVRITLIDRRNFHLFQPLLYQVATGGLSPGDIASPLRAVLKKHKNISVLKAEAVDIDAGAQTIILRDGEIDFDSLIVATGARHHYFGNEHWEERAPGLKTIEDALEMRRRIFLAFEAAEREANPNIRDSWLTFVVVGAGPTGVELAGALAELTHRTLAEDFRNIDPTETKILLVEGGERILPPFPRELAERAKAELERLGVSVWTNTLLTAIEGNRVQVTRAGEKFDVAARTVLWGAGVKASGLGAKLAKQAGVSLDKIGRIQVNADLTLPNFPNVFVIGDLANYAHKTAEPLPGVAPVAMQQGRYVAKLLKRRLAGRSSKPFRYRNKGSLAVIGRNAAVADLGFVRFSGFPAWLIWVFVHIGYLIEYDNKIVVLFQWAWNYFTRKRGARLITGGDFFPLVESAQTDRTPRSASIGESVNF